MRQELWTPRPRPGEPEAEDRFDTRTSRILPGGLRIFFALDST